MLKINTFSKPSTTLSVSPPSLHLSSSIDMATNQYSRNLLLVMDCLWFNQIILCPEPVSLFATKHTVTPPPQLVDISSTPVEEEEDVSSGTSSTSPTSPKDTHENIADIDIDIGQDKEDNDINNQDKKSRRRSQSPVTSKITSHSSLPTLYTLPKQLRLPHAIPLRKTMSLIELEHEELKGVMDLGFTFKKEDVSPRMMSVIPGLQRLEEYRDDDIEAEVAGLDEEYAMRPYLSEAWLIRRPDSPLLNLRIPRVLSSDQMKKHLRFWARTVASTVKLEC